MGDDLIEAGKIGAALAHHLAVFAAGFLGAADQHRIAFGVELIGRDPEHQDKRREHHPFGPAARPHVRDRFLGGCFFVHVLFA
jgi:hypothetical protein